MLANRRAGDANVRELAVVEGAQFRDRGAEGAMLVECCAQAILPDPEGSLGTGGEDARV